MQTANYRDTCQTTGQHAENVSITQVGVSHIKLLTFDKFYQAPEATRISQMVGWKFNHPYTQSGELTGEDSSHDHRSN